MPVLEYSELRKQFIKRHRESHKRFVERLSRDLVVHGVVPVYDLGEVRVRAEVDHPRLRVSLQDHRLTHEDREQDLRYARGV